ncbi:Tetratricopeptide repeat protein 21B [Blomia tropicalis]|nr:Tetratricopeptide repeat protein 21B [Blomia tropicalis]
MDNANEKILKKVVACIPGDPTYRFYNGCSLAFEGRNQEAIRELERCTNEHDLSLGTVLALLYCHKRCQVVDREAIEMLENRLVKVKEESNDVLLFYGGLFLLLSKDFCQAREYIDLLRKNFPNFRDGNALYGWSIILRTKQESDVQTQLVNDHLRHLSSFSNIIEPDVLMVRSKLHELLGNYVSAIEQLNQAIALYSRFLPALIEKVKLHAILKEFEQLVDTAFRALVLDKHTIEPQRYLTIYYLAWDCNEDSGVSRLQDLISALELRESKNGYLYYESSKLISRLAFRNHNILLHSFSLIERAVFLDPTNIDYICEQATQCILLKRYQDAERHYRNASKMDPTHIKPMTGLLKAQLMEYEWKESDPQLNNSSIRNALEKIYEEIDHLAEFNRTNGLTQELLYLCVKTYHRRKMPGPTIENYLEQILTDLKTSVKGISFTIEFYTSIEVNHIVDLIEICLSLGPNEPLVNGQQVPLMLHYAREFVNILLNAFPNHKDVLYLAGLIKYFYCEIQSALNLTNRCLQSDPDYINAHILMAKISIYDRNFKTAHKCLENALILDFQIRENIAYILAKASILKYEKKYVEALELLENSFLLDQKVSIKQDDKISLYLQMDNANKIIKDLAEKFQEPTERGRILLASAQFYCSTTDYDKAIQTLRNITIEYGADHFIRSRQMMAVIYWNKFKDRKRFTNCYREISDQIASTQSHLMLGDAYMYILEPEMAIEIYEQALKKNPKDYFLIRKVGQALIKAHFYDRALTFYKAAIKTSGQNVSFCYDLAHLQWRLNRFEQSKEMINSTLQSENFKFETDLDVYIVKIKLMHLLAQVELRLTGKDVAIQTLKQAHSENQKLMRRLPVMHPDLLDEHRKFSINLCKQLAELLSTYSRDDRQALQVYKDTLAYDDKNTEIYLQMAKIELQNQNFDMAHSYCSTILKHSPNLEESILMMADITFRQGDFDGALNLYNEILVRDPIYYSAMMRFIDAARRSAKLNLVPPILERAEKHSIRSKYDAGYYFCKGLYEWRIGNYNEAIKQLYSIRNDTKYGLKAVYYIVEICISSDSLSISGGDVFENLNSNLRFGDRLSSTSAAIKTAEILLEGTKSQNIDDIEYKLLANLTSLSRKQKNDAEYVLSEFMKLLSDERYSENVGIIYGAAMAFMVLKQTPKARNQLKRIAKSSWKYLDAEYLEKCWLMLADIHIQSNKFDIANELLRRILRYNRTCVKAYEYIGYIMEKEQSYRDAAANYELAWHYSNDSNPVIGFKLAFNYMKAKRYVDAIDITQIILERYP